MSDYKTKKEAILRGEMQPTDEIMTTEEDIYAVQDQEVNCISYIYIISSSNLVLNIFFIQRNLKFTLKYMLPY